MIAMHFCFLRYIFRWSAFLNLNCHPCTTTHGNSIHVSFQPLFSEKEREGEREREREIERCSLFLAWLHVKHAQKAF
jgi:hypothetical protein